MEPSTDWELGILDEHDVCESSFHAMSRKARETDMNFQCMQIVLTVIHAKKEKH